MENMNLSAMTDAELAEIIGRDELVKAARAEVERRKAESNPNVIARPVAQACVRRSTRAACPCCGRDDNIVSTKAMYDSPSLAQDGGEVIGTLAVCRCGAWFDAGTGQPVKPSELYTY